MVGFRIAFGRLVDVRAGEWRAAIAAFATLMVVSAAHAGLETARDTLLVTRLTQREFALVYIAVAACAIPATALINHIQNRMGARAVLLLLLILSAGAALLYASLPVRRWSVVGLYVTVGMIASCVFPQFWLMLGSLFTLAQGRRLLGPIASASVLGGVVGAAIAAGVVSLLPIRALLAICAAFFGLGALCLLCVTKPDVTGPTPDRRQPRLVSQIGAFRDEPFLLRIAAMVVLTTATALVIDYFFKWTVARSMPAVDRGRFIARYYLVMNAISLVLQVLLGASIVRRLGVATAVMVTPLLSLFGGAAALLAGASALPILLLKGVDGSVRSSVNRLTTELVYLPVSPSGRQRAKPLIDGALMRIAQAATAGGILAFGRHLSAPLFSGLVVVLAASWLLVTLAMRQPYLGQLRKSLSPLFPGGSGSPEPIDVASAELLVEQLGNDDPQVVLAAISTLARRGRHRLIPALVLLHSDERILKYALGVFAAEERTDWHTLADRLLRHPSETVRLAAAQALAAHGQLDAHRLSADSDPSVRGYAMACELLADPRVDATRDARLASLLEKDDATRLGMLAAVADTAPSDRASSLLVALTDVPATTPWATRIDLLARASVRLREPRMIPRLVALLGHREGRESVKSALAALGDPAYEAVVSALNDLTIDRQVRMHLPAAVASFGTKGAAETLLDCIERDPDGRVRYKAIRALEILTASPKVRADRLRVEHCVRLNLIAYFRLLATRVGLGGPQGSPAAGGSQYRLLTGLLDDKLRQSLERAFRLLRIAHPREDIRSVYVAFLSKDKRARANAAEYLDALLRGRDQQALRELMRLASDELSPADQVARAQASLQLATPRTREEAVKTAIADADVVLATIASLYAVASGNVSLADTALSEQRRRPALDATARAIFQKALPVVQAAHA